MADHDPFFWFDDAETNQGYYVWNTVNDIMGHFNKIFDREKVLTEQWGAAATGNRMMAHYAIALTRFAGMIKGNEDEGELSEIESFAQNAIGYAALAVANGASKSLAATVVRRACHVIKLIGEQRAENGGKGGISPKMMDFLRDPTISPFIPWEYFD